MKGGRYAFYAGAVAVVVAAALIVGLGLRDRNNQVASTPSPIAASGTPVPASSASPSASPNPSSSAVPASLPTVVPGTLQISTRPLAGPVGDWAFFVQAGFGAAQERSDSLIAVRLSDRTSQPVVETTCGSARCGLAFTTRLLDEQFSPDGRRVVLSVAEPAAA